MRSSSTFSEEMDVIGGVPGLLYSDSARQEWSGIRRPFAALAAFGGERMPVDEGGVLWEKTALQFDGQNWPRPIPGTGHVFGQFPIPAVSALKTGAVEELVADHLGLDVQELQRSASKDPATTDSVAAVVAKFGTEAFGTYLPWHVYAESAVTPWGMYFFLEPLVAWATVLRRCGNPFGLELTDSQALSLAFYVSYRHELFHFHVEWFCVRQEVLHFEPVYRPYDERVFRRVCGTDRWLEEALAQAVVLDSSLVANRLRIPKRAYRPFLESMFDQFGPGYRNFRCPEVGGPAEAHKWLAAQIIYADPEVPIGATEAFTPKREYAIAPKIVPGYIVWQPSFASRFQLTRPKRKRLEAYLRQNGFRYAKRGPGDHECWRHGKQTVQINYDKGEGDLASIKAVARMLDKPVGKVLEELRRR